MLNSAINFASPEELFAVRCLPVKLAG
jgi:hypothetical protein